MKRLILWLMIMVGFTAVSNAELKAKYDNYIQPVSYYSEENGKEYTEVKYQISIQKNLLTIKGWSLGASYTQQSFWDFYDSSEEGDSGHFRESNYNPQGYLRSPIYQGIQADLGYWHESNGQKTAFTRSWDRIYLEIFTKYADLQIWDVYLSENWLIDELLSPYELTVRVPLFGSELKLVYNKGYQKIVLKIPSLFLDIDTFAEFHTGYYDNLLDFSKKMNRFGLGVSFN